MWIIGVVLVFGWPFLALALICGSIAFMKEDGPAFGSVVCFIIGLVLGILYIVTMIDACGAEELSTDEYIEDESYEIWTGEIYSPPNEYIPSYSVGEALDNTQELTNYSTEIHLLFKVGKLFSVKITLDGNLTTSFGETTGYVDLSISGETNSCYYEYPIYNNAGKPYSRLRLENGKYIYIPFDIASLENGVVTDIPNSVHKKLEITGTQYEANLTTEEAKEMYQAFLDFFVKYASDNDVDLGEIDIEEATLNFEKDGMYLNDFGVSIEGDSKKGSIEFTINAIVTPDE